jgi:hypothetical protein
VVMRQSSLVSQWTSVSALKASSHSSCVEESGALHCVQVAVELHV